MAASPMPAKANELDLHKPADLAVASLLAKRPDRTTGPPRQPSLSCVADLMGGHT
jgi:hypothetical protein